MTFDELHNRICDAPRGDRPRLAIETIGADVGILSISKMGRPALREEGDIDLANSLRNESPGRSDGGQL